MRFTYTAASLLAFSTSTSFFAQAASWDCKENGYPYCVHVQSDNAPDGGAWPVMVFLPGSGARGPASNAASLAGYDGHGKLVSEYMGGNTDEAHSQAAEQFLTVVPIAPDGSRHFDPDKVAGIVKEVQGSYNVDSGRIYVSGYSMGGRGTHRSLVSNPEIWAAGAPSAGAAEDSSADTLQQEAAPQTFNKLQAEVNIPVWSFAGANDDTAGVDGSEQTEAEVKKLGGSEYKLTVIEGADHSAMNIKPWTDYDLLSWFLQQSKSGTSSPAQSGAASGAISVGASSAPAATETGSSGDDLEDDDDDWEDEDEEDCEEEDDDDDDDYDEEEECDEEDESTGSDQSGAQPNASGSAAIPASSGTVADGSGSSSEDEEDCDDSRYNKLRRRSPVLTAERHIIERQAHHHVFAHSKRNWEVPLDASMQHLAARQALAQDQKHKRSLAKRALTTHAHGHALGRRSGHSSSRMARVVRR